MALFDYREIYNVRKRTVNHWNVFLIFRSLTRLRVIQNLLCNNNGDNNEDVDSILCIIGLYIIIITFFVHNVALV